MSQRREKWKRRERRREYALELRCWPRMEILGDRCEYS